MDSNATAPEVLSAEGQTVLNEGIGLILSRWTALRAAVENGWGGRDSHRKAEGMASKVFDFFTQSRDPLDFDSLADILERGLLELNTEAEDGSIEEVTEKLLDLYEECLDGNYQTVETLRAANSQMTAGASVVMVGNNDEEDDESDDEDEDTGMADDQPSDMMVDAPEHCSNAVEVDAPEGEDGWTVVSRRKKN